MVLTTYYIEVYWVSQKHIISFVHVLPPHCDIDITDVIFKCLIEWVLKIKYSTCQLIVLSIMTYKGIKTCFSWTKTLMLEEKLFHM